MCPSMHTNIHTVGYATLTASEVYTHIPWPWGCCEVLERALQLYPWSLDKCWCFIHFWLDYYAARSFAQAGAIVHSKCSPL